MPSPLEVFLLAFGVGLLINMPPGPGAAILVGRTLREGVAAGLVSGLGIALGDAFLAWLVMVVIGFAIGPEWAGSRWLALIAAPALVALAAYFLYRGSKGRWLDTVDEAKSESRLSFGRALWYAGGMAVLAGAAPGTIPGLVVIFSAVRIAAVAGHGWLGPALVCVGVLSGAMTWWILITAGVAALRQRLVSRLHLVDFLTGSLLLIGAGYAVWEAFR